MLLSRQSLLARPYRYLYLLYDFIHRKGFELGFSGVRLPFDYMGNPYKFYTPDMFTTSHDVHDAVSWMKTTDIFFKHKASVYHCTRGPLARSPNICQLIELIVLIKQIDL